MVRGAHKNLDWAKSGRVRWARPQLDFKLSLGRLWANPWAVRIHSDSPQDLSDPDRSIMLRRHSDGIMREVYLAELSLVIFFAKGLQHSAHPTIQGCCVPPNPLHSDAVPQIHCDPEGLRPPAPMRF